MSSASDQVSDDELLAITACVRCGKVGLIKEIVYGMPDDDFDFDKFIVGGCCVYPGNPTHGCNGCGWMGKVY